MTVRGEGRAWVVPSHRAAWVPGGVRHGIEASGRVRMRTLYLRPDLVRQLPDECCVLSVSRLLRELVFEVMRLGMLREDAPHERNLARVLVDQLQRTPAAPLEIRWPVDVRACRVADRVHADVSCSTSLEYVACGSGGRLGHGGSPLRRVQWHQRNHRDVPARAWDDSWQ